MKVFLVDSCLDRKERKNDGCIKLGLENLRSAYLLLFVSLTTRIQTKKDQKKIEEKVVSFEEKEDIKSEMIRWEKDKNYVRSYFSRQK